MATTPTERAAAIVSTLRARIDDRQFRPRVWTADDGTARIYTGNRKEYIQINADGSTETSQSRMSWGHIIREVI